MPSKKKFLQEEKECAEMLGMTLNEYRKDVKNTKVSVHVQPQKYDNRILEKLGIIQNDMKTRKVL